MGDKKLIENAEQIPYTDWSVIDKFIEKAESQETKERLRKIQLQKFREEEYRNGSL